MKFDKIQAATALSALSMLVPSFTPKAAAQPTKSIIPNNAQCMLVEKVTPSAKLNNGQRYNGFWEGSPIKPTDIRNKTVISLQEINPFGLLKTGTLFVNPVQVDANGKQTQLSPTDNYIQTTNQIQAICTNVTKHLKHLGNSGLAAVGMKIDPLTRSTAGGVAAAVFSVNDRGR
ncbi:MAG: hypothetical protein LW855_01600 [Alphaproteobacteria bacterium]|nr:hypothetical protein [Alphaproteobacteria bacterium]